MILMAITLTQSEGWLNRPKPAWMLALRAFYGQIDRSEEA